MLPYRIFLHHSEPIDPTLLDWIRNQIDELIGLEPSAIAVILGIAIVAFPIWLGISSIRRARRNP
tara:strand:- start:3910 stop:4104 length:195 start_codon:yes stop_codon:yes gene_type:complete